MKKQRCKYKLSLKRYGISFLNQTERLWEWLSPHFRHKLTKAKREIFYLQNRAMSLRKGILSYDRRQLMRLKNAIHASTYIRGYPMLTLYIADVERDVGMKKLSQEEAEKVLENMKVKIEIPKAAVTQLKRNTALDMAIEALKYSEVPNSSDCISRRAALDCVTYDVEYTTERIKALPSLQPTCNNLATDCISRQAAIDAMCSACGYDCDKSKFVYNAPQDEQVIMCPEHYALSTLPSAQPETAKRIVGKSRNGMTLWYQCDMCNEPVDAQDDFCRGCGRRLTNG